MILITGDQIEVRLEMPKAIKDVPTKRAKKMNKVSTNVEVQKIIKKQLELDFIDANRALFFDWLLDKMHRKNISLETVGEFLGVEMRLVKQIFKRKSCKLLDMYNLGVWINRL